MVIIQQNLNTLLEVKDEERLDRDDVRLEMIGRGE